MNKYEDQLPVEQDWVDEHVGEVWTFTIILDLYELIDSSGIDEMNEVCDEITGVTLTDLSYRVAPTGAATVDETAVVIEATGTVEEN